VSSLGRFIPRVRLSGDGRRHFMRRLKLLMKISNAFDGMVSILGVFAGILVSFMLLSVAGDVFMRYFLARPMPWVTEAAEYSLVVLLFAGTTWVLRRDKHVRMDIVVSRLKPRVQVLLNITTSLLGTGLCLVVAWYAAKVTWEYFQSGYHIGGVLRLPLFYIMAIIPIGSSLLTIQFLRRAYGFLGRWRAL